MGWRWTATKGLGQSVLASTSALCSVIMLLTYPDDVAVLFMKLFKLGVLLMSPKRHSGDVEIRYPRQEWARESVQAVESDPVDDHAEIHADCYAPDEVA